MNKRKILFLCLYVGCALFVFFTGLFLWNMYFSTTRIAFVNYQVINLGQISKSNDNSFIQIKELDVENLKDIDNYDMVFVNGMGLRISEEQRSVIEHAADKGIPILTTSATNPKNNIISLDAKDTDTLVAYLSNPNRKNYRSMLNYVRKNIDRKIISVKEPELLVKSSDDLIYHNSMKNPDEELGFNSVEQYNVFLRTNNLFKQKAPSIVITGQMGEPSELIHRLEETGNNVYAVRNIREFIMDGHIDTVNPSAIINMAHGRVGDYLVDYLKRQNIPLFAPLNVNMFVKDWKESKQGMNGGFLSQSIVTPEIDGAIRPYALFANYLDKDNVPEVRAIPERLGVFVETVNNYVSLQKKPNRNKRVAIYYYKGVGTNSLVASGMEVVPSLFNLLQRMKFEGYDVEGLPATAEELADVIQKRGSVFGEYAEGALSDFLKKSNPEKITKRQYFDWISRAISKKMYSDIVRNDGEFPGSSATIDENIFVNRIKFGNIVLIPQVAAGKGDSFKVVHGTEQAPPHSYVASYLWARYGFKADVLIHFGTHGSLEFTPRKQVALGDCDWPDRLVGALPHFYVYSIGNVGEGVIAKRRSYAGLQSYLTPPFTESGLRNTYNELITAIKNYNDNINSRQSDRLALRVKKLTVQMGIHRDLGLDSVMTKPYGKDEITRIEHFAEELVNEKITGPLYIMGKPYDKNKIRSSVYAMTTEPVAYSLLSLDKLRGKSDMDVEKQKTLFNRIYLSKAVETVTRLFEKPSIATDGFICDLAGISLESLYKCREIGETLEPKDLMSIMMSMQVSADKSTSKGKSSNVSKALAMAKKMGAGPDALKKMELAMTKQNKGNSKQERENMSAFINAMSGKQKYDKKEIDYARAVLEIERAVKNVENYKNALTNSPQMELNSLINAFNGGYTEPTPGGDPIVNPNVLPTGRNLYAINAEATPSESAWEKGMQLANQTIAKYKERHNDSIPRKVTYTLWSSEFIETEGATVAQVLYMLGVEPVRDVFGRVNDLRLIPSEQLGRPRIDVVVQTSGQLRDIAASRLFLINRAVQMAANAKDDKYENKVVQNMIETEKILVDKGLTPKQAREISAYRVFGGVNGNYGTGITNMVNSGDRWENTKEIADVYLNNMGAFYGSEQDWEKFVQFAFEAALINADVVIQPRQSNTWGALGLDHVYEFMGGMNLAIKTVTGKEPDAYLSDYRNRNNARMQEIKEAVGIESRTTIFNPAYIKEKMKGGASSANTFAEIIQNTYGWNVMKPEAVNESIWNDIYDVYVKDKFNLGIKQYFERENPAALEEITAVMMETARKGMWKASEFQLSQTAKLHGELILKHKPSCSGFVCDNTKLSEYIASKLQNNMAEKYRKSIKDIRESMIEEGTVKNVTLKKQIVNNNELNESKNVLSNVIVAIVSVILITLLLLFVVKRKRH